MEEIKELYQTHVQQHVEKWKAMYCTSSNNGIKFIVGQSFCVYGFLPVLHHYSPTMAELKFDSTETTDLLLNGFQIMSEESVIHEYEFLLVWNAMHGCYNTKDMKPPCQYEHLNEWRLAGLCGKRNLVLDPTKYDQRLYLLKVLHAADDPDCVLECISQSQQQQQRLWLYLNWFNVSKESPIWIDFIALYPQDGGVLLAEALTNQLQRGEMNIRHLVLNTAAELSSPTNGFCVGQYMNLADTLEGIEAVMESALEQFPITLQMRDLAHDSDYNPWAFQFALPGFIRDWINAHVTSYDCRRVHDNRHSTIVHSFQTLDAAHRHYLTVRVGEDSHALQSLILDGERYLTVIHNILPTALFGTAKWNALFTSSSELLDHHTADAWQLFQQRLSGSDQADTFTCLLYGSWFWSKRRARSTLVTYPLMTDNKEPVIYRDLDTHAYFIVLHRNGQVIRYILDSNDRTKYQARQDDYGVTTQVNNDKSLPLPQTLWTIIDSHTPTSIA